MSRRVTVVLSQGRPLGAEKQHREDELVAELLMHPHAEATVIGDLVQISADSTDRLCLESIAGTAIVLAWHAPQTVVEALAKIGIDAHLLNAPAANSDANAPTQSAAGKALSVHYFDLNDLKPLQFYADRIAQVAEEADVSPVALTNLTDGRNVPIAASEPAATPILNVVSRSVAEEDHGDETTEARDKLDDLMDALDQIEL